MQGPGSTATETRKRRNKLAKKLAEIADLKQCQQLQPNQLAKIATEKQLREELRTLDAFDSTVQQQAVARPPEVDGSCVSQPYDYYCVIDFEATCQERGRIRPQEIIELPSVLLDGRTMSVVDEFQQYVRPVHHPVLTNFCTQLTGIQQVWVEGAPLFGDALHAHTAWLRRHGIAVEGERGRSVMFVSCGDWDLRTMLPAQLGLRGKRAPQHLRRWINIKHTYAQAMHRKASGMIAMLNGLGLELEGRHHSGIDDCRNIAKIVQALALQGVVLECTATTMEGKAAPRHKRQFSGRAMSESAAEARPGTRTRPRSGLGMQRGRGGRCHGNGQRGHDGKVTRRR